MLGLTSVSVFLFSALALAVSSGYSLGAVILLLASTCLIWKRPRLNLQGRDYLLLGTLLLYFLIFTANMLYHADPGREFDIPLRALLAVPVLLLLLKYPPRAQAWWSGLAIGAISGAMLALWQFFVGHIDRPQAATSNAIHYGNISILLGLLALCGLDWARTQHKRLAWSALLIAGCLFGILGSVLSGSRGGWLALPATLLIIIVHHAKSRGRNFLGYTLVLLVSLGAIAYALPSSPVRERVTVAVTDLDKFEANGDADTSIGVRMQMWHTAWQLSGQHPWLGLGRNAYMEQKKSLYDAGKISRSNAFYTNSHNDYLDTLVKRGIVGLMAVLLLFILPLSLFILALRCSTAATQPYALAGVILCTCYPVFGLTTSSLTLNIGIIMLVFPMAILWAMLRQQERIA